MDSTCFIQTRASKLLEKCETNFEVISFESYKPKGKKPTSERLKDPDKDTKNPQSEIVQDKGLSAPTFNIKKAKNEVMQLGMSGFQGTKKKEAKIQHAISLGAKPPKNKYKNYKLLLKEKKEEELKKVKMEKFQQLGKNKVGKSTAKGKSFDKKRNKGDLLGIYGTVKPQDLKLLKKKPRKIVKK